jgi:hypothetical protein
MRLTLSPEQALLVKALHPQPDQTQVVIPGDLHWERALEWADWHRLGPLLWALLSQDPFKESVPSDVLAALRMSAMTTAASNMNLQLQLDRVLAALAKEAIPVMLLKGAALIETVYPSVGLRPMEDVDLLVPRSLVQRAYDVVETLGYIAPAARFKRNDSLQLSRSHHHYPLIEQSRSVVIELHHHISTAWPDFDIGGFWERAVPGLGEVTHLVPSPEDLMLHVAVHFTSDRVERRSGALGQVADMARIAKECPLDWDALARRSIEYGVGARLFLALLSTSVLVSGVIPDEVVSTLRPGSYGAGLGEEFVRQRVLRSRSAFPLERLSELRRLLFPGATGLAAYVQPDEATVPSGARLRVRRIGILLRRLAESAASVPELAADIRLSRWIRSLSS